MLTFYKSPQLFQCGCCYFASLVNLLHLLLWLALIAKDPDSAVGEEHIS